MAVHILNILFTHEGIDSDSWVHFLQTLRPTFFLVFLLVLLLLWLLLTSREKLENEKRKFCSQLAEIRRQMDSSDNIGRVLDFLLQEASLHIEGRQPVPDVDTTFNVRLTECHVELLEGLVEGLNALSVEHAYARRVGSRLVLDVTVGVRQLRLHYGRYAVHAPLDPLPPFYVWGDVTITVSPVILGLELVVQTPLSVRLRAFKVSKMGSLKVDVTGLEEWNFAWTVAKWFVLPRAERELKKQIELQGTPIIEDMLRRVNSISTDIPVFNLLPNGRCNPVAGRQLELAPAVVLTPAYLAAVTAIVTSAAAVLFVSPMKLR